MGSFGESQYTSKDNSDTQKLSSSDKTTQAASIATPLVAGICIGESDN
mgnify:FL=1